jgi:hypothetical protein
MTLANLTTALRRLGPVDLRYRWLAAFIAIVVAASLKIGEHYPFSNFPMYGNPSAAPVDYYFLTDAAGEPLPTGKLTGDTAPKLKKRLNSSLNDWAKANPALGKSKMPAEVRARITRGILDGFVQQSNQRGTPLPDRVQLWRGDIISTPRGFYETFAMEAAN